MKSDLGKPFFPALGRNTAGRGPTPDLPIAGPASENRGHANRPLLPRRSPPHCPDSGGGSPGRAGRCRPGTRRGRTARRRHLLRASQGAGALGGGRPCGPAPLDPVVGRRARPLPGAGGGGLRHHRHKRIGSARRPGRRARPGAGDRLHATDSPLPRPAAPAGVRPPAHPRPHRCDRGHRGPGGRGPPARGGARAVQGADPRHRFLPGAQAGRGRTAGRPRHAPRRARGGRHSLSLRRSRPRRGA